MAAPDEASDSHASGFPAFTAGGRPVVTNVMRIRAFAFRECCLRSASRSGVASPTRLGSKWNDAKLPRGKIPTRRYAVGRLVLESIFACLPVSEARARQLMAMFGQFEPPALAFLGLICVFLSVIIATLTSTSEMRIDVSILGVLIISWALVHYLSKWIVEKKRADLAASLATSVSQNIVPDSMATSLGQDGLRMSESRPGRRLETRAHGLPTVQDFLVQGGEWAIGADSGHVAWLADVDQSSSLPGLSALRGTGPRAHDPSSSGWGAVGSSARSTWDVQCARTKGSGFSAKDTLTTDMADSMLWLLDLSVTDTQLSATELRNFRPAANCISDSPLCIDAARVDPSLPQLFEMFFEPPCPSRPSLTPPSTGGVQNFPRFLGERLTSQTPVVEPLTPIGLAAVPLSADPVNPESLASKVLASEMLGSAEMSGSEMLESGSGLPVPESLVSDQLILDDIATDSFAVADHIDTQMDETVDGPVGELLALISTSQGDAMACCVWTLEKLELFLSHGVSWSYAEVARIIDTTANHLLSCETARLQTPGIHAFEGDPYLPPTPPRLNGDVATYESAIVKGNLLWDFIDNLFRLFIRFNVVEPKRQWTHRTVAPTLNLPLRKMICLENLLGWIGFTLEVLDGGLSLLDVSMKPVQQAPAASPHWMSLSGPTAIEEQWKEELSGEDSRLGLENSADQCSRLASGIASTIEADEASARPWRSCRSHRFEALSSRRSRSVSDSGLGLVAAASCDEDEGSAGCGEKLPDGDMSYKSETSPAVLSKERRQDQIVDESGSPRHFLKGVTCKPSTSVDARCSAHRASAMAGKAKFRNEIPLFHACSHLNMNRSRDVCHQLQILFFNVVGGESIEERKVLKRLFIERLTRCYLLVGDNEAILIGREIMAIHLDSLSVEAGARCLLSAKRSPIGPQFSDAVERLYYWSFDGPKESSQFTKDRLWPILIDCRVHWKMYAAALSLLDAYCKDGRLLPAHYGSSVIELGVECERIDLINSEINRHQKLENLQSYMQVIRTLGRKHDVPGAVRVLHQLEADERLSPDLPIYNVVLDVCVSNRESTMAEELFQSMQTSKSVDLVSYNIMLKGYCQTGNLSTACHMLESMRLAGFVPDGFSYNSLISAAVTAGEMDLAWRLVGEMKENSIEIDRYTCSIMVKHLRPSCSPRDRQKLLALMENIDVCEDTILFSTVVDACARLKDIRRLRMALERFNQSGLRANVHAYGTLIKAYGRCEEVEKAWHLWREMTEIRNLEPSNYAFGCMLDTLVSNARLDEALQLFKSSLDKGRVANNVQYSILIKGCAKARRVEQALSFYQDMLRDGIDCNEVIYNSLINVCEVSGHLEKAEMILKQMIEAPNCHPDVISYSTLMKGFCSRGDMVRAFQIFHQMMAAGIQPDGILFNTLLEGCAKQSLLDVAEQVLHQMLASQVPVSPFTLTTLIKLYGRAHLLDKALQIAEEFPKKFDFELDGFVYTALIAACLTNHAVDKALEFFYKLNQKETRSIVSGRTFGTIIVGCTNAERLFVAYDLLSDAYDRGLEVGPMIVLRLRQRLTVKQFHTSAGETNLAPFLPRMISWLGDVGACKVRGIPPRIPVHLREVAEVEDRAAKQGSRSRGQVWNSSESIPPPPDNPYPSRFPCGYRQEAPSGTPQVFTPQAIAIPAPPPVECSASKTSVFDALRRLQANQQPFSPNQQPFSPSQHPFPSNQQPFPSNQQTFPSNQPPFLSNQQTFPSNQPPFPSNQQALPSSFFPSCQSPTHQFSPFVGQQWHFVPCIQPSPGAQCHMQQVMPQFYAPIGTFQTGQTSSITSQQAYVSQAHNLPTMYW